MSERNNLAMASNMAGYHPHNNNFPTSMLDHALDHARCGLSDGSLLFLLHLLSKMRPAQDGGSRFGIVLNGSPLFTGGAGSGESEIRRYLLENDLVEAIIGLPTDMFYNTGISTYVWIVSNRKPVLRKGKVQLIDASSFWQKMRRSLGSKRKEDG
jgi:type I restriction enzyme M protein